MAARVAGWAMSEIGKSLRKSPTALVLQALDRALAHAGLSHSDLDGFISCPALAEPKFMQAHHLATAANLLNGDRGTKPVMVRTVDTGGAGPITMLLQAKRMVEQEGCDAVAVVAGDSISSLPGAEFLRRADEACGTFPLSAPSRHSESSPNYFDAPSVSAHGAQLAYTPPSPVIPHGYAHAAAAHMHAYPRLTREQLAMVPVLMSHHAARHPHALVQRAHSLSDVLGSTHIAPSITLLECALRADGAAAAIVVSERLISARGLAESTTASRCTGTASKTPGGGNGNGARAHVTAPTNCGRRRRVLPRIVAGGEAAGPAVLPLELAAAAAALGSSKAAFRKAYEAAGIASPAAEVDYFGLYDCYPICFVRALEAAGLAEEGKGGDWVEEQYSRLQHAGTVSPGTIPLPPGLARVNTHGGLLGFGAPWEAPALFSAVEAFDQLAGAAHAGGRQVPACRTAVVYGNGGIFGASAVVVLRAD